MANYGASNLQLFFADSVHANLSLTQTVQLMYYRALVLLCYSASFVEKSVELHLLEGPVERKKGHLS